MASLTKLDTLLVPNNPEAEVFDDDWFLVFVEVTEVALEDAEVLLLATAAKVSKRDTAEASEAVRLGSDTLMFVGEFLFSVVSIGTSEDVLCTFGTTIGGGGGGGKAGGGVTLKSSEVEKSKSLDKPLLFPSPFPSLLDPAIKIENCPYFLICHLSR